MQVPIARMVEPDRVHRAVYHDPAIFDAEMENIFHKVWIYCGHESQVPKPGDYWTLQIGRQPMVMIRGEGGEINVLYNRCPHRGAMLFGNQSGNVGTHFSCSYHGWQFKADGKAFRIPLVTGYEGTRMPPGSADCDVKHAPRVDSYRGFVFASLAAEGPSLVDYLRSEEHTSELQSH